MRAIYDVDRIEIGSFDGRFVYAKNGKRLYWIDDGEVFSLPPRDSDDFPKRLPCVKVGRLVDDQVIDFEEDSNVRNI